MEDKIYTICAELKVGEITVNEATDRLLILFNVSGQLPPSDCSKCGRRSYSKGKPFYTDEFCNGGNFR